MPVPSNHLEAIVLRTMGKCARNLGLLSLIRHHDIPRRTATSPGPVMAGNARQIRMSRSYGIRIFSQIGARIQSSSEREQGESALYRVRSADHTGAGGIGIPPSNTSLSSLRCERLQFLAPPAERPANALNLWPSPKIHYSFMKYFCRSVTVLFLDFYQ